MELKKGIMPLLTFINVYFTLLYNLVGQTEMSKAKNFNLKRLVLTARGYISDPVNPEELQCR